VKLKTKTRGSKLVVLRMVNLRSQGTTVPKRATVIITKKIVEQKIILQTQRKILKFLRFKIKRLITFMFERAAAKPLIAIA
jgi:hypothetical protein